jgi:hypothetical protein
MRTQRGDWLDERQIQQQTMEMLKAQSMQIMADQGGAPAAPPAQTTEPVEAVEEQLTS